MAVINKKRGKCKFLSAECFLSSFPRICQGCETAICFQKGYSDCYQQNRNYFIYYKLFYLHSLRALQRAPRSFYVPYQSQSFGDKAVAKCFMQFLFVAAPSRCIGSWPQPHTVGQFKFSRNHKASWVEVLNSGFML